VIVERRPRTGWHRAKTPIAVIHGDDLPGIGVLVQPTEERDWVMMVACV
jgi:hypothetical protein